MKTKNRVFITATSSLSCAGETNQLLFKNIINGHTGVEQDNKYFHDASPAIGKFGKNINFHTALIAQCQNILEQSQLKDFSDTLLVVGSSVGGMAQTEDTYFSKSNYTDIEPKLHNIHTISHVLHTAFTFYDDISFSTACTSSANAIGYAHEVLSQGLYERVLVVGADSLSQTTVGGFLSLGVLSSSPCRPFDVSRDGMNVAEAIACLLFETEATKTSVEVLGAGYSSDAYHMTQPNPDGLGAIASMSNALKIANLEVENIDYINTHGTGTVANDNAEANAIVTLFGEKTQPYVSSTKSITGHTLGAAGALEAIISCMVLKEKVLPKNIFLTEAENPKLNLLETSIAKPIRYVMSNSFAFGGNNCSLIFGVC